MKSLHNYILEKLVVNKDYKSPYTCDPKTFKELRKIIEDRYNKFGPGTKQKPIDFNDVDVSNIDSFYNEDRGTFSGTEFEHIDISYWYVSNVKSMSEMFYGCERLKSVGDLSNWNVSKVEDMSLMFYYCNNLKSVGDLSKWNVSKVNYMTGMFERCEQLKFVGDLSNWNVLNVEYMHTVFYNCKQLKSVGDLSNWNVQNVKGMRSMFDNSGITNKPKWYKK